MGEKVRGLGTEQGIYIESRSPVWEEYTVVVTVSRGNLGWYPTAVLAWQVGAVP